MDIVSNTQLCNQFASRLAQVATQRAGCVLPRSATQLQLNQPATFLATEFDGSSCE